MNLQEIIDIINQQGQDDRKIKIITTLMKIIPNLTINEFVSITKDFTNDVNKDSILELLLPKIVEFNNKGLIDLIKSYTSEENQKNIMTRFKDKFNDFFDRHEFEDLLRFIKYFDTREFMITELYNKFKFDHHYTCELISNNTKNINLFNKICIDLNIPENIADKYRDNTMSTVTVNGLIVRFEGNLESLYSDNDKAELLIDGKRIVIFN
jgi:hypothetical protein